MNNLESALAGIEQMTSKATPGKWRAEWHGNGVNLKVGNDHTIGSLGTDYIDEDCPFITAEEIEANGELFAASRTLVPALVKLARKLMEQRHQAMWSQFENSAHKLETEAKWETELTAILTNGREGR